MGVTVGHVDHQAKAVSTPKEEQIQFSKSTQSQGADKKKDAAGAFQVEFGKGGVLNGAYAEKKSGAAGIPGLNGEQDLTASRNMDIVLAHTLSAQDYQKAREDGFDPSEIEAGETTTIVDHIKASLVQSGVSVSGVTDTLSRDQLTEITGSEALAGELVKSFSEQDIPLTQDNVSAIQDALTRARGLQALPEESLYYMVENDMAPSVDALYLAAHSAKGRAAAGNGYYADGSGYLAKTDKAPDLDALQGQIDGVLRRAGFEPENEQIQEEARNLIGAGVTLTPDHLKAAADLRSLRMPPSDELVIRAGAAAIANGGKASVGNLADPKSFLQKAVEIDRDTKAVTEDGIRLAVEKQDAAAREEDLSGEQKELTLRDLIDATRQAQTQSSARQLSSGQPASAREALPEQDARFMQARLQLEEVRFSMSVSVNMTMLRSGFSIDTAPMTALIDHLNKAIAQNAQALFGAVAGDRTDALASSLSVSASASVSGEMLQTDAVSRYRLYTQTNFKVEYMRTEMPLGVIGALRDEFKTDTLDDIFTGATTWKTANAAYENMQTEVRRDLGDNIKKAFRNADALLKDAGLLVTEDNLRAVRILGYNRMEITKESVAEVTSWDARLNEVLDGLKPAAVLELIRDGKNPLGMTLQELADELHLRNSEKADLASDEKYARFLYKLEQAGQISEAERTSYIGIYRMFETLQRTDHAAIGTLLNAGADMSIRNLLSATRSMRTADGRGIDVRAAADVAEYKITSDPNAIDAQIDAAFRYYSAKADTAFAHIAPEKMAQMEDPEGTLLPAFAEQMESLPADEHADAAFDAEQMLRMRETLRETEASENKTTEVIQREAAASALENAEMPLTAANLETYQALQNAGRRDGGLWNRLKETGKNTKAEDILSVETEHLQSALDEEGEYADIYRASISAMQDAIKEQMVSNEPSYIDYRALAMLHRQMGLAGRMAERGSFEIPVETDSGTVSMHVTLQDDRGQGTGVRISMETAEYGTLGAQFTVREDTVSGIMTTTFGETPQVKAYMEGLRTRMSEAIASERSGLQMDPSAISVLYGAPAQAAQGAPGETVRGASGRTLLRIAKIFTEAAA